MKTKTMRYVGVYVKYMLKSSKSQVCPSLSAGIHINSLDQGTSKFYNPTCDNGVEHCRRSWRKVSTRHMTRCCWLQWRGFFCDGFPMVLWGDKDGCSVTWRISPVRISGRRPWWICPLSRVVGPLPIGLNGYWDMFKYGSWIFVRGASLLCWISHQDCWWKKSCTSWGW